MSAQALGMFTVCFDQASGTSMVLAIGADRPDRTSTSNTASSAPESEVPAGMIGTAVGDDPRGHALADQLREWGVQGKVRFSKDIQTPMEVNVSDKTGARTYFWHRPPEMLATLDTADLSLLNGAQFWVTRPYCASSQIQKLIASDVVS